MHDLVPEMPPVLGMVLEAGRGSLPYSLVHGEPLVRVAVLALEEAGIEPLDPDTDWAEVVDRTDEAEALVLHDSLCPLAPPELLVRCAVRAVGGEAAVVAYRPVTDTLKRTVDGVVGETVDREGVRALASPVVLPAALVRRLPGRPDADLAVAVAALAEAGVPLEWVEAPPAARRVTSADDLALLEAQSRP